MILSDIVVLEIADNYSASFCGLQLVDVGAEVIKIESKEGDKFRKIGPYNNGVSQVFMSLNRGKKSISIDFKSKEGQVKLEKLLRECDILVTDWNEKDLMTHGIDYESVKALNRDIMYAQIYGYGKIGSYKDRPASELSAQAMSGIWRYLGDMTTPEAQKGLIEPNRIGVYVASGWAANFTFIGILAALYAKMERSVSQKIETSLLGSLIAVQNQIWASMANPDTWEGFELIGPMGIRDVGIRTKDGFVREPHVGGNHEKLMEFYYSNGVNRDDTRLKSAFGRGYPMVKEDLPKLDLLQTVYSKYSTEEILKIINEDVGSLCMSMNDYSEAVDHPQTKALNIVIEAKHSSGGVFKTIGVPWHLSDTQVKPAVEKPPLLGEHNNIDLKKKTVFRKRVNVSVGEDPEELEIGASKNGNGPLQGIKVIDFSGFAVGPWAGSLLGMLGAEVIKIDPPFGDGILEREPTQNGLPMPYTAFNQGKSKCISLNLKNEEDHKIALKLIEEADILIENFRTGVMDRLGLGYETVSKLNPRLIYCSSTGYGNTGPLAKWGAVDDLIQGYTGFAARNGSRGEPGEALRLYATNDLSTSMSMATMALLGLINRIITGKGQQCVTSMIETLMYLQTGRYAEYFATENNPERMRSGIPNIVPDQAFRTRDGFIAVTAADDIQWHKLCKALNLEQLIEKPEFRTNDDRLQNREILVNKLTEKFSVYPSVWWIKKLSEYGIPCAIYRTPEQVMSDRDSYENKFIITCDLPIAGKVYLAGPPFRFSKTPARIVTPAIGVIPKGYKHLDSKKFPEGYPGQNTVELKKSFELGFPLFDTDK